MAYQDPSLERYLRNWLPVVIIGGLAVGASAMFGFGDSKAIAGHCKAQPERMADLDAMSKGSMSFFKATDARDMTGLSFRGPYGRQMTLADFKGKTVLVTVWAEWCQVCRGSMPGLNELQRRFGRGAFEVVAVNIDNEGGPADSAKQFMKNIGASALRPYGYDGMGPYTQFISHGFGRGIPSSILVDAEGCLMGRLLGGAAWGTEDAVGLIKAAKKRRLPAS